MNVFQKPILVGAILAIFLASCETLPNNGSSNTVQAEKSEALDSSYELVNRSQVLATVKSKDVAVDLERQALEWGYTLKKQEKLEGLNLYLLTFDCPPGVDPKDCLLYTSPSPRDRG